MFKKKPDSGSVASDQTSSDMGNSTEQGEISSPPLKPFSKKGSHAPAKPPATSATKQPDLPRRVPDIPGGPRRSERARGTETDGKRLLVGRDISLKGEITSCDNLVVEGQVEVMLPGARLFEVSPTGVFRGNADVEEADIAGRFEGELIARKRLLVRDGGRIVGKIRYGTIVIEQGGEISGDMQTLAEDDA